VVFAIRFALSVWTRDNVVDLFVRNNKAQKLYWKNDFGWASAVVDCSVSFLKSVFRSVSLQTTAKIVRG